MEETLKQKLTERFERFGLDNLTVTLWAAVDYPRPGQHVKLLPLTPQPIGLIEAIVNLERLYTEAKCPPGSKYTGEPIMEVPPHNQRISQRFVVKHGQSEIGFVDTTGAFFFTDAPTAEKLYLYLLVTLGASQSQADWTVDSYKEWAKGFELCLRCAPWHEDNEQPDNSNPLYLYHRHVWLTVLRSDFKYMKLAYSNPENTYRINLWEAGSRLVGHPHTCYPFGA